MRAQIGPLFSGPCTGKDYYVLVYDARLRQSHIVKRSVARRLDAGDIIASTPSERDADAFLCDGKPAEVYIVNRKLKEVFNATVTGVVTLPSSVISIRGLSVAPFSATTTSSNAAKGAVGAAMSIVTVVDQLLSAESIIQPEQALNLEAENLRSQARQLIPLLQQYTEKLNHMIDVPVPLGALAPGESQGSATLVGTANAFQEVITQVATQLTDPRSPDIEPAFDRINVRIAALLVDIQRLNQSIQTFPAVDQLNLLQQQVEGFELGLLQYRNDIQTVKTAIEVIDRLIPSGIPPPDTPPPIPQTIPPVGDPLVYLVQRVEAEVRRELQSAFPAGGTPNMDANSIAAIAKSFADAGRSYEFIYRLRPLLQQIRGRVNDMEANQVPDALLLQPGAMRRRFQAVTDRVPVLRSEIDRVNRNEAAAFDAINSRYRQMRIPSATVTYLNLGGATGNLSVFYSISGMETFPQYLMTNETPQPWPVALTTTGAASASSAAAPVSLGASGAAAPSTTTAAAGSSTAAAGTTTAAAGSSGSSGTSGSSGSTPAATTNPPAEYYGNFQVHHFDGATIFGAFAFTTLHSHSFNVLACPSCVTTTMTAAGTTAMTGVPFTIPDSVTKVKSVIAGAEIYFKTQDMYPDVPGRLRGLGLLIGASVFPLNQYYGGLSVEPVHGFTLGGGLVVGGESLLPANYYSTLSSTSMAPTTAPTRTVFRTGGFFMVGFDINIFQAIFGQVTSLGSASAPSGSQ